MSLNAGDKVTHNESGQEAEYVAAIPTAGHGFLHLLKGAAGYIFRLTGDLEQEFSRQGADVNLAQENATTEPDLIARFETMLRSYGLAPQEAAKAAAGSPAPVPEAHLSPDLLAAQEAQGGPGGAEGVATPAASAGSPEPDGASTPPPVEPQPSSPPADSIPL